MTQPQYQKTFSILFVGDVHATKDSLPECKELIHLVKKTAIDYNVSSVVFLGDQFHHHGIAHLEVMDFWDWVASEFYFEGWGLYGIPQTIFMVGNHDKVVNTLDSTNAIKFAVANKESKGVLEVFSKPRFYPVSDSVGVGFIPYSATETQFRNNLGTIKEKAGSSKVDLIIAHQTFSGATYENGFYAKDGIDPKLTQASTIISGHIHRPQILKGPDFQVIYPGSPRWLTLNDANVMKSLLWVNFGVTEKGIEVIEKVEISTDSVCEPIYHIKFEESSAPNQAPTNLKGKITIDLKGSPTWLKTVSQVLKTMYPKCRIRTQTTARKIEVKESDGLDKAYQRFFEKFQPPNKTPKPILQQLTQERMSWS